MDADRRAAGAREQGVGDRDAERCSFAEQGEGERDQDREDLNLDGFEGQYPEEDPDQRDGERNDDARRIDLDALEPERRSGDDGLPRDAGDQQLRAAWKHGAQQREAAPPIGRITAAERSDRERECDRRACEEDRMVELDLAQPPQHATGRLE